MKHFYFHTTYPEMITHYPHEHVKESLVTRSDLNYFMLWYIGGTLGVVEQIPPFYVKRFEYPEKRYITNYYYYSAYNKMFA